MKRVNFVVAALVVSATLVLATSAPAQHGRSGGGGKGAHAPPHNPGKGAYAPAHNPGKGPSGPGGKNGGGAASSRPRNYNGWSQTCYFSRYRCNGYYSPSDGEWYYWYEPFNCYLPVRYMETYPPVSGNS